MKPLSLILAFILYSSFSYAQAPDKEKSTTIDERKNAVYIAQDFILTFSVNYERLFPLNEKINLGARGGLGRDGGNKDNTAIVEAIFRYGRFKHFFEAGLGYQQPNLFEKDGSDIPGLAIMVGYRYQSPNGFLIKIYPEFLPDMSDKDNWGSLPFLGFALGYSF